MSRIYVASSWRNAYQPEVVDLLRDEGHEVYDFRNPTVGYENPDGLAHGFHWSEIDEHWQGWSPSQYRAALRHPVSQQGYRSDIGAMTWADTCVLVLPCGRSAHAEAGWMAGSGRRVIAFIPEACEPELMYRMFHQIAVSLDELIAFIGPAEIGGMTDDVCATCGAALPATRHVVEGRHYCGRCTPLELVTLPNGEPAWLRPERRRASKP